MPSLPINLSLENKSLHSQDPQSCNCNFHAFLGNAQTAGTSRIENWLNFAEILGLLLFFSFFVLGPPIILWDVALINQSRIYQHAKLEYLDNVVISAFYGVVCYVLLKCILIEMSTHQLQTSNSKQKLLRLLVVISSLLIIGMAEVDEYMQGFLFQCLITLLLYGIVEHSSKHRKQNQHMLRWNDVRLSWKNIEGISNQRTSKFYLLLCGLFWIGIFGITCFGVTYFLGNFLLFFSIISTEKWVLKKTARQVDVIRLEYCASLKGPSFEIVTEFVISIVYGSASVSLFLFCGEICFIIFKTMHIIFREHVFFYILKKQQRFRSSHVYFMGAKQFEETAFCKMLSSFEIIQDRDTSYEEWKMRYCVDITLHFIAYIMCDIGSIAILNMYYSPFEFPTSINQLSELVIINVLIDCFIFVALYLWFWCGYSVDLLQVSSVLFVSPDRSKFHWQFLWTQAFLFVGFAYWIFLKILKKTFY
ncbi:hypothetical protein RFI_20622 [Reticulomyxa filosa]|uniref:Uncharacterized protein n=1 Tax=Reticulomyxa filosa TaxID=46433 RepID=X6MSQ8_RETFI|nr:hypothetical protein RFI_20622 [Reticulomyxa filosa]|eukprot:ETO16716.1 hypothetical protein RFI_20622 [Reticulomyxa filosa]